MLSPSKRYKECIDELKLWAPVALDAVRLLDPNSEPNAMLERPAFDLSDVGAADKRGSGLSTGYALRRYFLALGQFVNLLDVLSELFPNRSDQFGKDLARFVPRQEFESRGEVGEQVLASLALRSQPGHHVLSEMFPKVDDLADSLCETRRYVDFLRGANEISQIPLSIDLLLESQWKNELRQSMDVLEYPQRKELADRMQTYLSKNYVLNSMPVSDEHTRRFHEVLLSATRVPGEKMYNIDIDGFLDQMTESDMSDNDYAEIRRTLEGLAGILSDVPFGDLSDVLGDWGGMRSFDDINIIPSVGKKGTCHNTLLATASGSGASRKGFLGIMRQVRRHLIDCFGRTRIVILLTDTWDPAKFRESRADIEAHRRRGVVFITGVVSGRSISPTPLPF